ncbi:MAG TPA: alanine racemase [Flavobacteriaceae bacterium]|nr:alanine racemase [Flavobacteriaceae bacterium]
MSSSTIEISQKALASNVRYIRSLIGEKVIFSSVLKGNAYGHGAPEMVKALQELEVNHFSVFSSFEAREVFQAAKGNFTLMIMGDINEKDEDWIIKNSIDFYVFNFARLRKMTEKAKKLGRKINIHIEVETGMNRTGFIKKQWPEVVDFINENSQHIHLKGLCTHFAGAESISNYKRVKDQRKVFKKAIAFFKEKDCSPELIHCSCSAAVLSFPEDNYDMVRIGILQYGLWPSREIYISHFTKKKHEKDPLRPVLSWKSYIMDIKKVKKGNYIGYGNSYLAETDMHIASIPVGYGYGYSRSLSNQGRVIIDHQRLSIIGIINMNMFLVDVTAAEKSVELGDEVILIGHNSDLEITVSSFGNLSSQLNYEVLSRIDKDVPRILKP